MKQSMDVLVPPVLDVVIRDRKSGEQRVFQQTELSIRQIGDLVEFIAALATDPANGLNVDDIIGVDPNDPANAARILMRIAAIGPDAVGSLLGILLGSPEDASWIADNIPARQVLPILQSFVEQNDVAGIVRDFFALQRSLQTAVAQAKQETP